MVAAQIELIEQGLAEVGAKSVVRAWVAKANRAFVEDDPFMSESEWAFHRWAEANSEAIMEFARVIASAGMTREEFERIVLVLGGDDGRD